MLPWRWFNRPRHPLARLLLAVVAMLALAGIVAVGFFALVAFAFIGGVVALVRALARSQSAAAAPQPRPAGDHARIIEGEYVVVDSRRRAAH
jgi:hypothetical protein